MTTLADIAKAAQKGKTKKARMETFGFALRNFLDEFYRANRRTKQKMLGGKEPARLRNTLRDHGVGDAYLAALANHLTTLSGGHPPTWATPGTEERIPAKPWFSLKSPEARIWLLTQSPAAFRERNLFISEDALSRA